MRAHDVMTPDVTTVAPEATVPEIAQLLLDRGISAVPVLGEAGALAGIVSEGDLLRRRELGTDKRRRGWRALLADPDTLAREYIKSRGLRARDIMTSPVISVGPDATVSEVADVMEKRHIKRVPVVELGKLVGMITRSDLIRALVRVAPKGPAHANDESIRNTMLQRLGSQRWAAAGMIDVAVHGHVVQLSGQVMSDEQLQALTVMAESIPGMAGVDCQLSVRPRLPLGV